MSKIFIFQADGIYCINAQYHIGVLNLGIKTYHKAYYTINEVGYIEQNILNYFIINH